MLLRAPATTAVSGRVRSAGRTGGALRCRRRWGLTVAAPAVGLVLGLPAVPASAGDSVPYSAETAQTDYRLPGRRAPVPCAGLDVSMILDVRIAVPLGRCDSFRRQGPTGPSAADTARRSGGAALRPPRERTARPPKAHPKDGSARRAAPPHRTDAPSHSTGEPPRRDRGSMPRSDGPPPQSGAPWQQSGGSSQRAVAPSRHRPDAALQPTPATSASTPGRRPSPTASSRAAHPRPAAGRSHHRDRPPTVLVTILVLIVVIGFGVALAIAFG